MKLRFLTSFGMTKLGRAAFASLFLLLPALAHAQEAIATDRLVLTLDAQAGGMEMSVRNAQGQVHYRTGLPGIFVDGQRQQGFVQIGARQWQNETVTLAFDETQGEAVALTIAMRDGQRHDLELHLLSDDETEYYGTGERFNALNQRGYIVPVITDDRYGNKGVGTHKPVPFFMSSRGFGVWVDAFVPGVFDLSGTERFVTKLHFAEDTLRVVLIPGPELGDVLHTFTDLTGHSPVPPPWAFGLWKSRDVHHNQDSVYVDIHKLREYDIPASVIVLDSPWETGYNDFEVNRQQFPDPEQLFADIQRHGYYVALWLTPFVNHRNVMDMKGVLPASSNYDEAVANGYLITDSTGAVASSAWWKGEGGLVDFTNPAATAWWHGQLAKTKALGAHAFKCDDGEGNFVPDAVFHDGSSAREMKNRYARLYNQAMQQYVDEHLGGDGVLIVRSGHVGNQQFPFSWAGDNDADFSYGDGLPSVVLAGQNAALSGIPLWGSDIAGYAKTPTKEVFIRWTQFAAFSPFMQVHMTSNLGPWDFDAETLTIFRDFTRLRTELFPYLYDAVHEAARTGMPVIRPMALAFQNDPEARLHPYQYLYGPDLLVAPIVRTGTSRDVYLPDGVWYDYWTGTRYESQQTMEVEAPLDKMPLFVRAGAILPRLPGDVQTLIERHDMMDADIVALDDRRILEIWPGGAGTVSTYDGLTAETDGTTQLRVTTEQARPLEIHLLQRRLDSLSVPGATVRYDGTRQRTILTFPTFSGTQTIKWSAE